MTPPASRLLLAIGLCIIPFTTEAVLVRGGTLQELGDAFTKQFQLLLEEEQRTGAPARESLIAARVASRKAGGNLNRRRLQPTAAFVLGPAGMKPWGSASIGPNMFPDTQASWIWSDADAHNGAASTNGIPIFIKEIVVDAPTTVLLHAMVDDVAEVRLNGAHEGVFQWGWGGDVAPFAYPAPIKLELRKGLNTLALGCTNAGGSAGLLASVVVEGESSKVLARTDGSWKYFLESADAYDTTRRRR